MSSDNDKAGFTVIINNDNQLTIWPQSRDLLPPREEVGQSGTKEECMTYIQEVWTDASPNQVDITTSSIAQ